jgi:hypothetical protein
MKKFNKLYNIKTTKVKIPGMEKWYKVKEIDSTRQWIKLEGLEGSFQVGHIDKFTNKSQP